MNPQLQALLTLQQHDDEVAGIERKIAALAPKFAALDAERGTAQRQLAATRAAIAREEERQRELGGRAEEFRRMNARAVSHMDQVRKPHEAAAAQSQVDISRKALADVEAELGGVGKRLSTLRDADVAAELGLSELDEKQTDARAALDAQRTVLEEELAGARARRQQAASHVDARTLVRYDRVRSRRRSTSVYPLRGTSCSNCDTAVPTQHRSALLAGDTVEVCESCGVLLYAAS